MPKYEKPGNRSHYVTSTFSGERVQAFVPPPLPPGPKALGVASLQTILAVGTTATHSRVLVLYVQTCIAKGESALLSRVPAIASLTDALRSQ
jgi:hypothetical protein